jgi:glycosyltransferase involved in cell wall biosynthesis
MKIVIVNYRYFISGGPERYLFNIKELLERNGHVVIPFSVKNRHNETSEYEKYFLNPIGDGDEIYFREYNKSDIKTVLKSFSRMFYSFEAKRKLNNLIRETKPDIIYVLHYQNKISASIFDAAVRNKVPVVHRISDFGQICANGLFYRARKKDICERCLHGSKMNAVFNKCVYNSYIFSSLKVASLQLQKFLGVAKKINAFVVPSRFTITKLRQYGFPEKKIMHIPTFFNFQSVKGKPDITYEPFALFVGRIEEEKGLMTLIKAFENTEYSLKIIGASSSGYDETLKSYLKNKKHNIEFLGSKKFEEIQVYLGKCAFTVMPTEIYDNFPNTVLESYAFKKCVLATDTGSLREIITDNETGILFPVKDFKFLKDKIQYLFSNRSKCIELGEKAFGKLNEDFSAEKHYRDLIGLFETTIAGHTMSKTPLN